MVTTVTQATSRRCRVLALLLAGVCAVPASAQPFPPMPVLWQTTAELSFNSVAFSTDGQYVGAGANRYSQGRVLIWQAADGVNTLDATLGADVNAIAFTPDGSALVAAHAGGSCQPKGGCGGFGNELSRWAVPAGGLLERTPYPQAYLSLRFAPDGQRFAGGNRYAQDPYHAVRFHDPETLDSLDFLPAVTADEVAFSPDGSRLVTGGFENVGYDGSALVWDLATRTVVLELPHNALSTWSEFPESVDYAPDGRFIATGGWFSFEPTVKVWDAMTGALVYDFDVRTDPIGCGSYGLGTHVVFSPNSRYLAGATSCEPSSSQADLVVRFWDLETGEVAAAYGMMGYPGVRGIGDFALAPAGNRFAFGYGSGSRSGTFVVAQTELELGAALPTASEPLALPEGFRLSEAYPNPFNPATSLRLEVAEPQRVTAVLYDALGRRVATLFDGPVAPGAAQALRVEAGALPSGAYVVRVEGETFAASRRVTLLK